jgi:hypothetical protein
MMKLKEFDITLDIKKPSQVPLYEVVVGDYETNIYNIKLEDDGQPYPLEGLDVEIAFAKPDRTTVVQDKTNGVVIDGDTIKCTLASNTIAVSGTVYAEVRVLQDTKVLTSPRFRFYVRSPILDDKTIASSNEFPMLVQALEDAKGAAESLPEINSAIDNIRNAESELNQSIGQASALDDTLNGTIQSAEQVKDALCYRIETAGTAKTQLDDSISSASTSKSELDNSIAQAGTAKNELDGSIAQAGTVKGELDSSIATAGQTKTALDESIATGDLVAFRYDFESHLNDYATYKDSNNLKVAKVEKELNDYKATMQQVNINQEPKQKATGYGVVNLPKNAANGQVSVSVKGNTETDEEGNTKSTISAGRFRSVGKNLFNPYSNMTTLGNPNITRLPDGIQIISTKANTWTQVDFKNIKLKPNTTYYLNYNAEVIDFGFNFVYVYYAGTTTTIRINKGSFISPADGLIDIRFYSTKNTVSAGSGMKYTNIQLEEGTTATAYEPYRESNAYIIAKGPEAGEILELRSLPNGVKDEINVTDRKLIKRIGEKSNIANGTVIDFADMAEGGTYYAWNEDGETETGIKGDTLGIDATTLIYQLAEPVEIPVQVSGTLLSYPSGTVYVENVVADAGLYSDGIIVLHQDLPIKSIEKISKIDYETGLETILDASKAVIASDKLSFTHPDLSEGDIVFFEYEYDLESTQGETEIEYYDSRYVIKDSVTDKFYKWNIVVANGQPSIELVEV